MIDVNGTWIPQIIGYAVLLADPDNIRPCWVNGQCQTTSVTSFSELIEQVFDDLDSDKIANFSLESSNADENLKLKILRFIQALRHVEECQRSGIYQSSEDIIDSIQWESVVQTANALKKHGRYYI